MVRIIEDAQNRVNQLGDGFLEEYVRYASELTDAPEIFHCGCALVLLSSVIGPRGWDPLYRNFPNLWVLLLGPSTIYRKTTSLRIAQQLLKEIDESVFIASDYSPQALWDEFEGRKGQASVSFRDEVSGFFNSIQRHSYMAGMKANLIKLFDGDDFTRKLRKETIRIEEPFFTWVGGAVTEKLMDSITEEDIFSGFMIRFILLSPIDRGPIRPLTYESAFLDDRREDLIKRLIEIRTRLDANWSVSIDNRELKGSSPYEFYLNPKALNLFSRFVEELEDEGAGDPIVEKINGRIGPLTLKLMILFAADHFDHTTKVLNSIFVDENLILKSMYWAKIFQSHMLRVLSGVSQSQRERKIDRIVEFIGRTPGVTRGRIMRRFKLTAREMDETKSTLLERRMVRVSVRVSSTRSAEVYSTIPLNQKEKQE